MSNQSRTLGILAFALIALCASQSVMGQDASKATADEAGQTRHDGEGIPSDNR